MPSTRGTVARISGDRWSVLTRLIDDDAGNVLDVGCRRRELREHLPVQGRYVGVDLEPPADVIASAEEPLPFSDDEFHSVVLADVLEHLNDPHGALDEAMRVAECSVVLLLPNMYTLWLRLQYALGRPADKYVFGPDNRTDRHRWLMNFDQASAFARGRAERAGWHVAKEYAYSRAFRRLAARAAYGAARTITGPNVWAWEYAARLEPESARRPERDRATAGAAGP